MIRMIRMYYTYDTHVCMIRIYIYTYVCTYGCMIRMIRMIRMICMTCMIRMIRMIRMYV